MIRKNLAWLALAGVLAGCNQPLTTPQKGAITGAALGSGIGMVAGGSFGQVVGAGLIGGALGYVGGSAIENNR
jgi:hypothetical protein